MTPEQASRRYLLVDQKAQRRRREAGLCVSCHQPVTEINPSTGRLYWRCAAHRKMATRASERWGRALRSSRLSAGLCRECGCEADRNPGTGNAYALCRDCRIRSAAYQTRRREREKAARVKATLAQWEQERRARRSTFR